MARIDPNTEDFIKRALGLKDGEAIPEKIEAEYMRAKFILDKGSGGAGSFSPQQTALILFAAGVDPRPKRKTPEPEPEPTGEPEAAETATEEEL